MLGGHWANGAGEIAGYRGLWAAAALGFVVASSRFEWHLVPVLRRYPLIGFFLLAFSFTWLDEILLRMLGLALAIESTKKSGV